jgi:hypothetical protein
MTDGPHGSGPIGLIAQDSMALYRTTVVDSLTGG